jgi:hypothetical protein
LNYNSFFSACILTYTPKLFHCGTGETPSLWAAFLQHLFLAYQPQQEIDLVKETDGQMTAFEIKWKLEKKNNSPKVSWRLIP